MTFVASLAVLLTSFTAQAQIQTQPVEIIEAAPPSVFSERSGYWPTETFSPDVMVQDRSTLNERWNSIPGVQARESGSPTISIRGSAQADRVLKLFEGAPLNMADGVGASDLLIPTEVMSQVSLLKGPASVFYGTSAMSGAIDHRLRYFERLAVKGSLADESSLLGSRNLGAVAPWKSKSETSQAQASVYHESVPGNFRYHATSSDREGRRDHNDSELTRATLAANTKVGKWSLGARVIAARSNGSSPGALDFPLTSTFQTTGTLATVEASNSLSETQLATFRVTNTQLEGLYDKKTTFESTSDVSRTTLNADLRSVLTDSLLARSFVDVSFNKLSASYIQGQIFHLSDTELGQSYELALSPEISIQPAYRYTSRYGKIFKALGLIRSKNQSSQFLTFGEGFRAPSLTDRYASYSTFQGNPSLRPEKSWAVELGGSYENGKRYGGFLEGFGSKASIYYIKFDDLVDTQVSGAVSTKVNSGEARTYGGEASLAYGYKIWMLSLGYNYLDAKNETQNEPLRLAPTHQAVATLAQLIGPVLLEARGTYWSSFYDREAFAPGNLRELPSWTTFDFTARTLALTDWEIKAGVMNLLNKNRELTLGYPEPQRRFFVNALRFF